MTVIEGRNLVKEYKQGEDCVKALDGVNISVSEGEFVAITGESGSGKSTLLNILGCMDLPTSGEVFINGEKVTEKDSEISKVRNEEIGMVFQAFHLLPMLTAEENIAMPARFAGKKVSDEEVDKLLKELSLEKRGKHLPSELSGGQQQRVAIGRALANNPKILFADEPTGNLDKKNSEEIIALLLKIKEERNMTLVLVTHSEKIAKLASRRIYMEDGRIVREEVTGK